jgi:hypothetical protein
VRVEGESAELALTVFPEGLIPDVLGLVLDVWKSVTDLKPTDGEIKINRRLARAMQRERRHRGLQFSVRSHGEELENLDEHTGTGFSQIDILFQHGYDDRCYFAFEAKKLNGTTKTGNPKPGAGEYVGEPGMGGFIDGTYACEQPHGGMIGYVMDGDCSEAKTRVTESIARKAGKLRMSSPCRLERSRHFPECPDVFETRHQLDRGEFVIFHVLLAAA